MAARVVRARVGGLESRQFARDSRGPESIWAAMSIAFCHSFSAW